MVTSNAANAQFLNFDFTVNGNSENSGTVTGEILGLENNSTSTPSEIIIDSISGGFHGDPGGGTGAGIVDIVTALDRGPIYPNLPLIFMPNEFALSDGEGTNQFTVSNGQIISGDLYATDSAGDQVFFNSYDGALSPLDTINGYDNPNYISVADNGFSGATYTQVVPEPPTWAFFLGGLGLLVLGAFGCRGPNSSLGMIFSHQNSRRNDFAD
jgi:hypothetical protein